jgi:transglutaminase-like putative cysteine protease
MALHAALTHRTVYRYDRLVGLAPHTVRLRPAPHCRTPILAYSLRIDPVEHFINWQQDPFGNLAVINPFDFFVEDYAQIWPFAYEPGLAAELKPYLEPTANGPLLERYMKRLDRTTTGTSLDYICDLNRQLSHAIKYLIRMEPGVQTPDETLAQGSGSCRDTGWLLVQILRRLGLAARFVSGYLIQLKPDVKPLDGPAGTDKDFTDLHAWAEVYLPGAGWIGLDPTSGLVAGEGHIPLAATPAPSSAAPISGAHDEAKVTFDFAMSVTRLR